MQYTISGLLGAILAGAVWVGFEKGSDKAEGAPDPLPAAAPDPVAPADCEGVEEEVQALRDERDALEDALRKADFHRAIAEGQLDLAGGTPRPWPQDLGSLPEAQRPHRFEAALLEQLDAHPEFELDAVDCSECPCIAAVSSAKEDMVTDLLRSLQLMRDLGVDLKDDRSFSSGAYDGPEGPRRIDLFATNSPGDDPAHVARLEVRLRALREGLRAAHQDPEATP